MRDSAQEYCPSKLGNVPTLLAKYRGSEVALLEALVDKYGPEPPPQEAEYGAEAPEDADDRAEGPAQPALAHPAPRPAPTRRPSKRPSIYSSGGYSVTSAERRLSVHMVGRTETNPAYEDRESNCECDVCQAISQDTRELNPCRKCDVCRMQKVTDQQGFCILDLTQLCGCSSYE